ncbi:MAG TPA: glycine zipper 2TM domain-containing protein [Aliidongia sp.]|uniref:glycine zipper 2TM domain-containing protein n=1 Tax=Aliidongia sp. TaxID=1914230 RepID=UPI002DDD2577|nr:glycine zipper 2TM domain-containing protein [Aliidongia sp.]HEV2676635.1 glycine zipper 2TM domain-containing protein [Aliidongia sp.]
MRDFDTQRARPLKKLAIAIMILAPLALGACAETVGAGAGAYAGNQFGKGDGKTAATVGGAVGGALIGHEIAH